MKVNHKDQLIRQILAMDDLFIPGKNIGEGFLNKVKHIPELWKHNQNTNFENDFLDAMHLRQLSEVHKNYNFIHAVLNIVYPMMINQTFIYRENNQPKSFISLARFNKQTEEHYFYSDRNTELVSFENFNKGDRWWIIDVIAPWGHIVPAIKLLSNWGVENGYEGERVKFLRQYPNKKKRYTSFIFRPQVWDVK